MNWRRLSIVAVWIGVAVAAPIASAEHPIPEAERWATITHPGNQPFAIPDPIPTFPTRYVGRVDHEYQISRTEVTGAEWLEFVNGYAPYIDPFENSTEFTSRLITRTGPDTYSLLPGRENKPVAIGWRFAARYVNWLHNDKRPEREAFENGVYDASTFSDNPDATITDQVAHHPDARYWIPTQDEWTKSAHWDPNKNGPGSPGYWFYSHSSDTIPLPGAPGTGGQTSTGGSGFFPLPDVAAYRDIQSPWGLWDTTGGAREWTETPSLDLTGRNFGRFVCGSAWNGIWPVDTIYDQIDRLSNSHPRNNIGFRIARPIPCACSVGVFSCAFSFMTRRRRQIDDTHHSHRVRHVRPLHSGDRH